MSQLPNTFSHYNELWASLLIEELTRLGVRHICIAPGSRSTPLTLAAIKHPKLSCPSHFDERGLGFFALGMAKATQQPVALIVTSGSAVANLYPAVVEAYQTQQPIILLTADRPDELIDCGANQAIEQPNIFAHFKAAALNLSAPCAELPLSQLLQQIDQAVQSQPQGPVHINCPFHEPLYPTANQQHFSQELATLGSWLNSEQPWQVTTGEAPQISLNLPDFAGVIIAGALSPSEQQAALALQAQLKWPLIADIQSSLRGQPNVLNYPEISLNMEQVAAKLENCQQFLLLGGRLVSKTLHNWLEQRTWQYSCQISAHPGPFDAGLLIMQRINGLVSQVELQAVKASSLTLPVAHINQTIQQWLSTEARSLSEGAIAASLQHLVPTQSYLMLGNSLPIRLFEQRYAGEQPIITNRGASGIDGLLATACGLATGQSEQPITLVLGDLSLLHDLNSLALNRHIKVPLVVILFNNDGGNIFDLLPVPEPKTLDDYYRLRHGYQFAASAQQFGWQHAQPQQQSQFEQAYRHAITTAGAHLIEVITPPGEAASQLKQAIADASQLTL